MCYQITEQNGVKTYTPLRTKSVKNYDVPDNIRICAKDAPLMLNTIGEGVVIESNGWPIYINGNLPASCRITINEGNNVFLNDEGEYEPFINTNEDCMLFIGGKIYSESNVSINIPGSILYGELEDGANLHLEDGRCTSYSSSNKSYSVKFIKMNEAEMEMRDRWAYIRLYGPTSYRKSDISNKVLSKEAKDFIRDNGLETSDPELPNPYKFSNEVAGCLLATSITMMSLPVLAGLKHWYNVNFYKSICGTAVAACTIAGGYYALRKTDNLSPEAANKTDNCTALITISTFGLLFVGSMAYLEYRLRSSYTITK